MPLKMARNSRSRSVLGLWSSGYTILRRIQMKCGFGPPDIKFKTLQQDLKFKLTDFMLSILVCKLYLQVRETNFFRHDLDPNE